MMQSIRYIAMLAAALSLAGPARAQDGGSDPAVIHFAAVGGIRDWRAVDNGDAILIEGRNGMWYRATFFNYCPQVQYRETLAFVTDSTGDLTGFSSVLAGDRRCYFKTLERTNDPDEIPDLGDR